MTWVDRIKAASYTAPSGKKFEFQWEEVEESFDHKSSVFRFPEKDGAEIQSLGVGEHRFPITAFVAGDDYDIEAQKFMDILEERGNGILIHPIYGRKSVQPTNIKRTDKPISDGNQAVISVLFLESKEILAKETVQDKKKTIEKNQDDFDIETPEEFENQKRSDSAQDLANSQARFERNISSIDSFLGPVAALNEEVNASFTAIKLSLNNNLTDLVGKPLTLASQIIALIKTPARIVQSLSLRIQGYKDLATELRNRATINSITNDTRNSLLEARFLLSSCVSGMAETILLENYITKESALTAAFELSDFHDVNRDFIELQEGNFNSTSLELLLYGDSEESKNLTAIVEETGNLLSSASFNLQQERTIVLNRERNIIELTFELYGNLDNNTLDLLIDSNNLTGEEIILLPREKEIVYYV